MLKYAIVEKKSLNSSSWEPLVCLRPHNHHNLYVIYVLGQFQNAMYKNEVTVTYLDHKCQGQVNIFIF